MRRVLRYFVDVNVRASRWLDKRVPSYLRIDGNRDFRDEFVWKFLIPHTKVYDIGGGKNPFLTYQDKIRLDCTVVGVDISREELSRAPYGTYDAVIVGDITSFVGQADADVVICQAVLEHVANVNGALASMASLLKQDGVLLVFVPCRNALFAKLNLLLPESVKRRLLFTIYPSTQTDQGFPTYYDSCTPSEIVGIMDRLGLRVGEIRRYYMSSYFSFFFPLYVVWRIWTLIVASSRLSDRCETFSIAATKET